MIEIAEENRLELQKEIGAYPTPTIAKLLRTRIQMTKLMSSGTEILQANTTGQYFSM